MIKHSKFQKFTVAFLLVTLAPSVVVGFFGFSQQARAQVSLSVPVQLSGGSAFGNAEAGNVPEVGLDKTNKELSIIEAASLAAMSSAFQVMTEKFNKTLEEKLGIKNFLYYQEALIEGKYLLDSYRKQHGEDSVPQACKQGDTECLRKVTSNLPLNLRFNTSEIAKIAVKERQSNSPDFAKNTQKLIVGAANLFTSGISCEGVDGQALTKMATYLASASAGVLASEIDPGSGTKFYEQMARLGSPFASKDFWVLNLMDTAMTHEGRAKAAASLELTAPGLKSTQKPGLPTDKGGTKIQRSLNLVSVGQANANNALFNIALQGYRSRYDTSSFRGFITDLVADKLGNLVYDGLSRLLGGIAGIFPKMFNTAKLEKFKAQAEITGRLIAKNVVKQFAVALFDRVSSMIFQGEILGESSECRQGKKLATFESADTKFTAPANLPVLAFGDTLPTDGGPIVPTSTAPAIVFEAPAAINLGDTALLAWDASALGTGLTVRLSGGPFFDELVEISGSRTDTPAVTTTYILTVTGPNINQSASRTVTVGATSGFQVQFDVQPRAGLLVGDVVTVTWDATAVAGAEVQIFPLSAAALPVSGSRDYIVRNDTTFVLTVTSSVSAFIEVQTIDVSVINDGFERVFGQTISQPAFGVRE